MDRAPEPAARRPESLKPPPPESLVPMDVFAAAFPIKIDLVYANPDHPDNHFGQVYHAKALLWLHGALAENVLRAALHCRNRHGWTLKINDGLRPVEAQARMAGRGVSPLLLSAPGQGGHPRGMAVDIEPLSARGEKIDMGTPFDFFAPDPAADNPAARDYAGLTAEAAENRRKFERAMHDAATVAGMPLLALPQEWWDFRLPPAFFNQYGAFSEESLRPAQRMIAPDTRAIAHIRAGNHAPWLAFSIEELLEKIESES